jgi:tetratricopeptide (TPR) repeat protein
MNGRRTLIGILTGSDRSWRARTLRAVILLTAFPTSPTPATPQVDGEPIALGQYRVLHSARLGEDRLLQIHLPAGYETGETAYPVLYLFYSDWVEGYFTQAVNDLYHLSMDRTPPMILVGIPNTQRYRDLYPWPMGDGRGGEAERFLSFVQEELFPFVESQYRTMPYRIMVGPQAAAVFGAYALLQAPKAFQAFILSDPCRIDGEDRSLCADLVAFSRTPGAGGKYLAVSHDASDVRWDLGRLRGLEAEFREGTAAGFRWRIQLDEGWPFFLAPVEIREALLDLFADYPFQGVAEARGLDDVLVHYEKISRAYGFPLEPPNMVLSQVSDHLVEEGAYPEALTVLNRLVEIYPSSLDGPWRLANLYRVMGDTATAIRYYEECLRRDPNITPARDWLERLRGGR